MDSIDLAYNSVIKTRDKQQGTGDSIDQAYQAATRAREPQRSTIGGYPVIGTNSSDPIHFGTHAGGGVYDITERTAKKLGKSFVDIATDLADQGFIVAIRRKGQRGITNDHIHFADPKINPKEAERLRKQSATNDNIFGGDWMANLRGQSVRRGEAAIDQVSKAANIAAAAVTPISKPKKSKQPLDSIDAAFEAASREQADRILDQYNIPKPLKPVQTPTQKAVESILPVAPVARPLSAEELNAAIPQAEYNLKHGIAPQNEAVAQAMQGMLREPGFGMLKEGVGRASEAITQATGEALAQGVNKAFPHIAEQQSVDIGGGVKPKEPWLPATARNIGETAAGFATFLPQAAVAPGDMIADVPQMAQDMVNRWSNVPGAVKQGQLGSLIGDAAMVIGGIHGVLSKRIPGDARIREALNEKIRTGELDNAVESAIKGEPEVSLNEIGAQLETIPEFVNLEGGAKTAVMDDIAKGISERVETPTLGTGDLVIPRDRPDIELRVRSVNPETGEVALKIPGGGVKRNAEVVSVISRAQEKWPAFKQLGDEIAGTVGGTFGNGVKSIESLAAKVERKQVEKPEYNASTPKDHVRGKILIKDWSEAPTVIRELQRRGFAIENTIDQPMNEFGYRGLHSSVSLGDGVNGEIQVHTPESWALKLKTDDIYQKWRNEDPIKLSKTNPERYSEYISDRDASQRLWSDYWDSIGSDARSALSESGMRSSPDSESIMSPARKPLEAGTQTELSPESSYTPSGLNQTVRPSGNRVMNSSDIAASPESGIIRSHDTTSLPESNKGGLVKESAPKTTAPVPDIDAEIQAHIEAMKQKMSQPHEIVSYSFDLAYDAAKLGYLYIKKGIAEFEPWRRQMIADFGEKIIPHLQTIWDKLHVHENPDKSWQYIESDPQAFTDSISKTGTRTIEQQAGGGTNPPSSRTPVPPGGETPEPGTSGAGNEPTHAGNMNLAQFDLPEDMRREFVRFVEEKAAQNPDVRQTEEWTRGRISHEQTRKDADLLDLSIKDIQKSRPGKAYNNAELTAIKDVLKSTVVKMEEAKRRYEITGSLDDKIARMEATEEARLARNVASGASAEAGRALEATKILKRVREEMANLTMSAKERAWNKMLDNIGDREMVDKLYDEFDAIPEGDTVALTKWLNKYTNTMKPEHWLHAYQVANLLSNPVGRAGDLLSTGLWNTWMETVNRPLQILSENATAKVKGVDPQMHMSSWGPALIGGIDGLRDGMDNALHIMKHGMDREQAARLEISRHQELGGVFKPLRFSTRVAGAVDAINRGWAEMAERYFQASNTAKNEGLSGEAYSSRVQQLVKAPTEEMLAAEKVRGDYSVFQESDAFLKKIQQLQNTEIPKDVKVVGGFKPVKWIMPFVRTAYNIQKLSTELTPAGLIKLLDPKVAENPAVKHRIIGNAVAGTMATIPIIYAAVNDKLTGMVPSDKKERDEFYASGKKPYSVLIGDKWYSYRFGAAPFVPILGAVATIADTIKRGEDPDQSMLMKIPVALARTTADFSSLQGLRDLDNAINNPESSINRWGASVVGGLVPASGLLRKIVGITDPKVRDAKTVGERVASGIPGVSNRLPAQVDNLGKDIKRAPTGLDALNPYGSSPETDDPVVKELIRLHMYPSKTTRRISAKGDQFKLTNDEFRDLQTKVGSAIYEAVDRVINSDDYDSLTDDQKADRLEAQIQSARRVSRTKYRSDYSKKKPIVGTPAKR
ncbi:MAG: hypothetical protein ABFD54_04530 [Armatimonadota bacterium]